MLASAMAMLAGMLVVRRTTCRAVGGMHVARTGRWAGLAVRTVAIPARPPQELPEQNETGSDQKENPDVRHFVILARPTPRLEQDVAAVLLASSDIEPMPSG